MNIYDMGKVSIDVDSSETSSTQTSLGTLGQQRDLMRKYSGLVGHHEALAFENEIDWDVDTLCSEVAQWILDDDAQPASTSLVGIFSSLAFEKLIAPLLGGDMSTNLRLLVEMSSVLYCSDGLTTYAGCRSTELWSVQAHVGTKVLQSLDVKMAATFSASISSPAPDPKALFLALLATIIAVSYSRAWKYLAHVSIPQQQSCDARSLMFGKPFTSVDLKPQGYDNTQEQLLRILAHHLILIGKRTPILDSRSSEKQIIDDASSQWKRKATFEWREMPNCGSSGTWNSRAAGEAPRRASSCRYHLSSTHPVSDDCRPVGGFGTCVWDLGSDSSCCGPSPMDQLLASIEGLSIDSVPQRSLYLEPNSDLHPNGTFACGCRSISDTTVSTPPNTLEDLGPMVSCQFGLNSWLNQEIQTTTCVCQSCAPQVLDNMPADHSTSMATIAIGSVASSMDENLHLAQAWGGQSSYCMGEVESASTTFYTDPLQDHTLEQLSEVTTRLSSLKVV